MSNWTERVEQLRLQQKAEESARLSAKHASQVDQERAWKEAQKKEEIDRNNLREDVFKIRYGNLRVPEQLKEINRELWKGIGQVSLVYSRMVRGSYYDGEYSRGTHDEFPTVGYWLHFGFNRQTSYSYRSSHQCKNRFGTRKGIAVVYDHTEASDLYPDRYPVKNKFLIIVGAEQVPSEYSVPSDRFKIDIPLNHGNAKDEWDQYVVDCDVANASVSIQAGLQSELTKASAHMLIYFSPSQYDEYLRQNSFLDTPERRFFGIF